MRLTGPFTTQLHLIPFLVSFSLSPIFYQNVKYSTYLLYLLFSLSGSAAFLLIPIQYFLFNLPTTRFYRVLFVSLFPFLLRHILSFQFFAHVLSLATLFCDTIKRSSSVVVHFFTPLILVLLLFSALLLIAGYFKTDIKSIASRYCVFFLLHILLPSSIIGSGLELSSQFSFLFALINLASI